jgi:hypothetical protein
MRAIFSISQPALDALLAFDCVVYVLEALEIDEAVEFVFCGESRASFSLVLAYPSHEIAGDARVQGLRAVRHDVDKIHRSFASWLPGALENAGLRMTKLFDGKFVLRVLSALRLVLMTFVPLLAQVPPGRFIDTMRAIFLIRSQPLMRFSRSIAL